MRIILTIIFYAFIALRLYPSIYFHHIGVKEGLSQLSVQSIYQDKLGRMWFGTMEGISIHNGIETINYKNDNPIPGLKYSSMDVYTIVGDKNGNVFYTIGSHLVRYDFEKDSFSLIRSKVSALASANGNIYLSANDSIFRWDNSLEFIAKLPSKDRVNKIFIDSNNQIWVGTSNGLYKSANGKPPVSVIKNKDISAVFESSTKDLWIGTRLEGFYRLDSRGTVKKYESDPNNKNSISSNHIRTFAEDKQGNIWIGTFWGLNKYNPDTDTFTLYNKDVLEGSLSHSSILSLLVDNQNMLWVGTYYGGVNFFNTEANPFNYYSNNPSRNDCLNFPFIGHMAEDNDNNLWICTEGGGLNFLDRNKQTFKYFTADSNGNSLRHNNLKSIYYDSDGNNIYIGTYTGGLSRYNLISKKFTNYPDETQINGKIRTHKNINQISTWNSSLVILDESGLFKVNADTYTIEPLFEGADAVRFRGYDFIIDPDGKLWLINTSGITCINLNNPSDRKVYSRGSNGLGIAVGTKLLRTSAGTIYVTTEGSGVFKLEKNHDTFTPYTAERGHLLSNYCYNIAESKDGNLIITSDKGITFLNPQDGVSYSAVIGKDLPFLALNNACGLFVCEDGEIYVGTADGLVSFFEANLFHTYDNYKMFFSNIYVNNRRVSPSDDSGILKNIIASTSYISLNYKQNNLIFSFSNSNYNNFTNSTSYEYILEGFDSQWETTNSTRLIYTNLNPGKYLLKVREKNTGKNTPKEIQLTIVINSPFYNTPVAWIIYIFFTFLLIYLFVLLRQRQITLKASLEYERKEKEYIKDLNKVKLSFFTNISHEFRTPLTLIISQIEILLQNNRLQKSVQQGINRIYRNSFQMRNLINELLDFQKMDQQQIHLRVCENDIVSFIKEIYLSFEEQAKLKQIKYTFNSTPDTISCWFDPEQLQKVFYNILANAFKFTDKNGNIEILINEEKEIITVKIVDNGIGIEKKELDKIFEKYYQTSNSVLSSQQNFSTGLGLALSKDIVELHHGNISVESKIEYGSIFIVRLKTGVKHFMKDANVTIVEGEDSAVENIILDNNIPEMDNKEEDGLFIKNQNKEYTILIIEDHEELLNTLSFIFSPLYNVITAKDGKEGLEVVANEKVDIILSDVMMPNMSGTEMSILLKNNINTCHIPIILLTAQTSTEKNIEGLQTGADDYITKPFNSKILLAKCNNLIRNRILQRQKYKNEPDSNIELLANNELDKKFLKKVEDIINRNLSNTEFTIDVLSQEIAMSRASLYTKFKHLTGTTPNDFILNYKLKQASFLLVNKPDLQINDIADELGFNSARYFSRCFKELFKMSPIEYRKNKIKSSD